MLVTTFRLEVFRSLIPLSALIFLTGAIHLGKGVIERDIERTIPDRDAELVLYCGGGFRSVLAAEALGRMGYRRVSSMDGGWRRWCELGYPVTTD